jgi:hypothetical protein
MKKSNADKIISAGKPDINLKYYPIRKIALEILGETKNCLI